MNESKETKVAIVVPVYKQRLDSFERISLSQMISTLNSYDLFFVTLEGFECNYPEIVGEKVNFVFFDKEYFDSTDSYSSLLMNEKFYDAFDEYDYILIHQLDCFVFKDTLKEFLEMGFDYIGAPIHQKEGFWNVYHVGNGGLSLRNVRRSRAVLKHLKEFQSQIQFSEHIKKTEDAFFSYCAAEENIDYVAAPVEIANKFSLFIDTDEKRRSVIYNGLPFGIHYFPKYYYDFWKPFIQSFGYKLPNRLSDERDRRYLQLMNQWMILKQSNISVSDYLIKNKICSIAIYGMSVYGRHLMRELSDSGVAVKFGIDRNPVRFKSINVFKPDEKTEDTVDAIINTVIWDHDSISANLKCIYNIPVINLENIIFDLANDSQLSVIE